MSEAGLQKRPSSSLKEKGQYLIAFGVVASMLVVANIPVFVVFFFGVFAFFLYKMFAAGSRSEVRDIFEFYLSANEMLREDDRRWYGFELRETIDRGENLIQRMSATPPLVHFALGALYNKVGDHKSAVRHLTHVIENDNADEKAFVYPTPELRSYVKILRKIEREPAEAPLTSAAIRSLERARKLRGGTLLEESRTVFATAVPKPAQLSSSAEQEHGIETQSVTDHESRANGKEASAPKETVSVVDTVAQNGSSTKEKAETSDEPFRNRKPISEVLHDIYDTKRA